MDSECATASPRSCAHTNVRAKRIVSIRGRAQKNERRCKFNGRQRSQYGRNLWVVNAKYMRIYTGKVYYIYSRVKRNGREKKESLCGAHGHCF